MRQFILLHLVRKLNKSKNPREFSALLASMGFLAGVAMICFIVVPIILAIVAVGDYFGGSFFAYIASFLFVSMLPYLGAPLAAYAAVTVWGWHWVGAILVFLWPVVLPFFGAGAFSLWTLLRPARQSFQAEATGPQKPRSASTPPTIEVEAKEEKK